MTTAPDDSAPRTRVLVVDEHRAFASLLSLVIAGSADLECVATAATAEAAQESVVALGPDVVVLDLEMSGGEGPGLLVWLTERDATTRVVLVTEQTAPDTYARAVTAGAAGLVPKEVAVVHLAEAIRSGTRDALWAPPELVDALRSAAPAEAPPANDLTPREFEVLTLLAEGLSVQQISRQLGLSIHTTRGYVKTLLAKLEAHSQLEAVIVAARRGLISAVV